MKPAGTTSWSTQQLTELLALVTALPEDADVVQRALEHTVESLDGDVGALVSGGTVVASLGYAAGLAPVSELLSAAAGDVAQLHVPGAGVCGVMVVDCDALPGGRLLLGRQLPGSYDSEERSLFRGFSRVLSLALQARRALGEERAHRVASERDAQRQQDLLTALGERQALLERLSRIQRSISSRRPLHEVLDSIVQGASELIGDDISGLRLLDPDDPDMLVLAASTGLTAEMQESSRRSAVGAGIGGRAVSLRDLVHTDHYPDDLSPLPAFSEDGVTASMAAPVFQGDEIVGSLVVASREPGRRYTDSEKEVLLAFAEHTGLAVNDARTVTALQEAVSEATRQAREDSLTGLPNRVHFLERLNAAVSLGKPMSVLFIDLDDFKLVNDTLGHPIGDALLRVVGERIVGCVRGEDVVARLGGDEFAVLLRTTPPGSAELTAERIRQALSQPFHLPGHLVTVGASTGIVLCEQHMLSSAEELLRDADVAMYRAKALGPGRAVTFTPNMRVDLQARSRLERDLRKAIDCSQLVVHFQPVVDTIQRRVVGSEALLRWQHPELGMVPPFVPVAEHTGMIVAIGRQVLLDATRQTARWNEVHDGPLSVSVNVSARQLTDGTIVRHVAEALETSRLSGALLTLELTESVLVDDVTTAAGILTELKALGVHLAIDDFGTGYSSLSYLAQLPVDILKVDKTFVADATVRNAQARLAASVVALANSLELQTVVEGIETDAQLALMQSLGCRYFQGYLWSPPLDAQAFETFIRRARHWNRSLPRARGESRTRRTQDGQITG